MSALKAWVRDLRDAAGDMSPIAVAGMVTVFAVWHRPNAMPGGGRLVERWEAVIVYVPEDRRNRDRARVSNVLTASAPSARNGRRSFVGSKPAAWTRWVLDALGYDPATDTLDDIFPGSGAVSAAADGMLSLGEA
ncbi:hypothetical protein ACFVR6_03750 [Microbacterium sp. NPDC058021]|uniref:hypothetical protein n=1 Tax=Microbacterium sp. NPDC058021 TaxID=3346306 RepID=UPI0036D7DD96